DNFHGYDCSKAEAAFKLRDDRNRHTFSFNDSAERILEAKKNFFKNIESEKKLTPRSLQIKNFYLACMDEKAGVRNEQREIAKLKELAGSVKTPQQFAQLMIRRLLAGEGTIFGYGATSNMDNPKVNDFVFAANIMNLPEYSYYDNKELMADYRRLMIDFFKLAEPQAAAASIEARVDNVIKLEKQFVEVIPHPAENRQRWTERRQEKQSDFFKKYPLIEAGPLFKKIPPNTLVFNVVPEGFELYNKSLTPENLQTLKDVFVFRFGKEIFDDSNPEYFKKKFDFNAKYLGGAIARADRQERCTKSAMYTFTKELDQLLVKKLFPDFPVEKFKTVASRIRESIITGLNQNTWLEASSKSKAILKMQKAKLYLIQPETPKQWDFVEVRQYSTNDRFLNSKQYQLASDRKLFKSLKDGANLEAWEMGPLTVNAYYDASANKFV
ncbi:MAG: M13 family peptidase, partial [Bdellovibrionaceae bacterium]|nr:M13 family peptidase [Pseudobdellovibrionaceae bacterium]